MIINSQSPPYKSSDRSLHTAEKSQFSKAKALNSNENQTGKWSPIKKIAAVLASLSCVGFGTIHMRNGFGTRHMPKSNLKPLLGTPVELDSNKFIPPLPETSSSVNFMSPLPETSSSVGFIAGSFLAILVILAAAYYKFGKPKNSMSKQPSSIQNKSPDTSSKDVKPEIQKEAVPTSSKNLTTPPKNVDTLKQSSSIQNQPPVTSSQHVKSIIPKKVAHAESTMGSLTTVSPQQPIYGGIQLKPAKRILTQKEKIELDYKKKTEKQKNELNELPHKEIKKNDAAYRFSNPIDNLDDLNENQEYKKIEWMNQFKTLMNESKAIELTKILLQKIDTRHYSDEETINTFNEDFKLYAKQEFFWTIITDPKLKKAAIDALSPKQIEILVSEAMSCKRIPLLNNVLLTLSDCENNEFKKKKLKEIAKCGHSDLNKGILEQVTVGAAYQEKLKKKISSQSPSQIQL